MSWWQVLLSFLGVGTLGLAVKGAHSWVVRSREEAAAQAIDKERAAGAKHRATVARTAGDMVRQKAREDADRILKDLPLDPSDEEADRLLREAEDRLKAAQR